MENPLLFIASMIIIAAYRIMKQIGWRSMNQRNIYIQLVVWVLLVGFLISTVSGESAQYISIDFKNTDIRDVLRALASQAGVNMIIENDVTGTVSISLNRVTFTDALNIITSANQLTYTYTDKVYTVKRLIHTSLSIDFQDGLLSVEAVNVKLSELFKAISQKSGMPLIPAEDLTETVSISIPPAPLADAVNAILARIHCMAEPVGSVSLIKRKSTPLIPFTLFYENDRLTIDAKNVPLPVFCRALTEKTGISVVPDQNATQNITVYLQNLSMADSLQLICATNGLLLHKEGEAWRITRSSGAFRVRFKDGLLSVDADNVDIMLLAKEISRQIGQNIIVDRDVRGTVTVHFQDLPLSQGLAVILENQGWLLEKHPSYLQIRSNPNQNKNIRITYDPEKNLFDLDIQTAPLTVILNEMARRADLNIVILSQVNWTVNNLRLQKMSFTQVMDFIFKGTIFTYTQIDGTYVIGDGLIVRPENRDFAVVKIYPIQYIKSEQLLNTLPPIFPRQNFVQLPEKNALIVTAPPSVHELFIEYLKQVDVASIEDRTEVIKISYLKAEDVLKMLPSSIPKNDLIVLKEANAIVVTGPQNLITQVKSYIEKIDQINPLIVFDIMVLQITDSDELFWKAPNGTITLDNGKELYFNPSTGGVTLRYSDTSSNKDLTIGSMQTQKGKAKAKILANPTITTLNGYPARFDVSTKRSYTITSTTESTDGTKTYTDTVKTYDSGLYVTITPWVSANNHITMEIKPKISEFGAAPEGSDLPTTTERSTETTVRVKDGETIIISGLKNTRIEESVSKVPFFGDIPIVGYLFKNTTKREAEDEFVIIITPRLIYDQPEKQVEMMMKKYSPEAQEVVKPKDGGK